MPKQQIFRVLAGLDGEKLDKMMTMYLTLHFLSLLVCFRLALTDQAFLHTCDFSPAMTNALIGRKRDRNESCSDINIVDVYAKDIVRLNSMFLEFHTMS
jgi:hypothetical protein